MRTIFVIAKNTFREAIRDRILYGILAFAVLFILLTLFIARLSMGDMVMIRSFGLAGIYIFGLIASVFLGSSIIYKEIERRTLYFVLSKPVSRRDVILGKFFGLFAAIILTVVLMAVIYVGVIKYEGGGWDARGLLAIFFEILELGVITALLLFLSTVVAPLLATLCAIIILFIGHLLPAVLANTAQMSAGVTGAVKFGYYVLPNLEKFNLRDLAVHDVAIPGREIAWAFIYAAVYAVLLLFLANFFLKKKEL